MRILQDSVPEDNEILRTVSIEVSEWDFEDKKDVEKTFREICSENNGIGLAAVQVGILERFFFVADKYDCLIINPSIEDFSGIPFVSKEGCLSRKGLTPQNVKRYPKIKVSYQTSDGKRKTEWVKGLASVIFQHEIDHLDGIII